MSRCFLKQKEEGIILINRDFDVITCDDDTKIKFEDPTYIVVRVAIVEACEKKPPDVVLFKSNRYCECEKFANDYLKLHHGFFTLEIRHMISKLCSNYVTDNIYFG